MTLKIDQDIINEDKLRMLKMRVCKDNMSLIPWHDVKNGDTIYALGDFIDGNPTCAYGPYTVKSAEGRILTNFKDKDFTSLTSCSISRSRKPIFLVASGEVLLFKI